MPVINSGLPWYGNHYRDFNINGETMVQVVGGAHMSGRPIGPHLSGGNMDALNQNLLPLLFQNPQTFDFIPYFVWDLGLAHDQVKVSPQYRHKPLYINDYGGDFGPPAELMWMMSHVDINMTLYHYDLKVLDAVMCESMGGMVLTGTSPNVSGNLAGDPMNIAGGLMGNNQPLLGSGNHYVLLRLTSQQLNYEYRFPATYIPTPPLEIPLGTKASMVNLTFRSVPYANYIPISGSFETPDYRTGPTSGVNNGILFPGRRYTQHGPPPPPTPRQYPPIFEIVPLGFPE